MQSLVGSDAGEEEEVYAPPSDEVELFDSRQVGIIGALKDVVGAPRVACDFVSAGEERSRARPTHYLGTAHRAFS